MEGEPGIRVSGTWWRLIGDRLVLGLTLDVTVSVEDVWLCLVRTHHAEISYSSSLVRMARTVQGGIQPETVEKLGKQGEVQTAALVVGLQLGELCRGQDGVGPVQAGLHYSTAGSTFTSPTMRLSLSMDQFHLHPSPLLPHVHTEEAATHTVLALFTTGVRESLGIHTSQGSLPSPLPLPSYFSHVPSLDGHILSSPSHPLHLSWVQFWVHTSQSLTVLVLAPDYCRLSLLVSLLHTMLPYDAVITPS